MQSMGGGERRPAGGGRRGWVLASSLCRVIPPVELGAGLGFEFVDVLHDRFAHHVGGGAAGGHAPEVAAAEDVEATVGGLDGADHGEDLLLRLALAVLLDDAAQLAADIVELAQTQGVGALVDGALQLILEGGVLGLVRQGRELKLRLGLGEVVQHVQDPAAEGLGPLGAGEHGDEVAVAGGEDAGRLWAIPCPEALGTHIEYLGHAALELVRMATVNVCYCACILVTQGAGQVSGSNPGPAATVDDGDVDALERDVGR